MTIHLSVGVCDTCGAPATMIVCDLRCTNDTDHTAQYEEYEPRGPVRRGCDLHPVYSMIYSSNDTLKIQAVPFLRKP